MHAIPAAVIAAIVLAPGLAAAQDSMPPSRLGNIWDNQAHQPTRDDTTEQEKAAGLRADPAAERRRADEVQQLDKQVLQRAQQGTNDGVMSGTEAAKPLPPP